MHIIYFKINAYIIQFSKLSIIYWILKNIIWKWCRWNQKCEIESAYQKHRVRLQGFGPHGRLALSSPRLTDFKRHLAQLDDVWTALMKAEVSRERALRDGINREARLPTQYTLSQSYCNRFLIGFILNYQIFRFI